LHLFLNHRLAVAIFNHHLAVAAISNLKSQIARIWVVTISWKLTLIWE